MNQKIRSEGSSVQKSMPSTLDSSDQAVRVNGLEQVIDLLRHADPAFRNSLIKRLQARDPALAQKLLRIIR